MSDFTYDAMQVCLNGHCINACYTSRGASRWTAAYLSSCSGGPNHGGHIPGT